MSNKVEDCTFCEVLDEPKTAFDVSKQLDNTDISIMPTLGMLLPGYLLSVTHEHFTSFAQMEESDLGKVDRSLSKTEKELAPYFGNYFRLEHGSDNITTCGSGGCIDHAHQHLVPADEDVGEYIFSQLDWQKLDSYEDIAQFQGSPYIYLGRLGLHYVVPEPELPGQWVRRQIAKVRELENWDWATYRGDAELTVTLRGLKNLSGFKEFEGSLADDHLSRYPPPV